MHLCSVSWNLKSNSCFVNSLRVLFLYQRLSIGGFFPEESGQGLARGACTWFLRLKAVSRSFVNSSFTINVLICWLIDLWAPDGFNKYLSGIFLMSPNLFLLSFSRLGNGYTVSVFLNDAETWRRRDLRGVSCASSVSREIWMWWVCLIIGIFERNIRCLYRTVRMVVIF